jgi:phenylpropionate dioxygenase-like ring-hydroxylating dioxygenase large terminal subunit
VFVSLADDGPSLEAFLGDFHPILAATTSGPWKCNWRWEHEYPCNWKLGIENTVETYHLPCVHKKTFTGIYPSEEAQAHELEGRGSVLRYDLREAESLTRMQRWVVRQLGGTSTDVYTHYMIYPHLVFTTSDLYTHAHVYLPVTPTKTLAIARMYSYHGTPRGMLRKLLAWSVARSGRKSNRMIQLEDAAVFPALQRGLEASPHTGCLGTREERIWAFQRYIFQQAGSQAAPRDELQKT